MAYDMGNMKNLMNKKTPINMGSKEEVTTDANDTKNNNKNYMDKIREALEAVNKQIEMAMETGEIPQDKGMKLLEKTTELFTFNPDAKMGEESEEEITSYKPNKKRKKTGIMIKVGTVPQEGGVNGTPAM